MSRNIGRYLATNSLQSSAYLNMNLNLTEEQWDFLAALHALKMPVTLEIAGKLSPILPAPFWELLGRSDKPAMICEVAPACFAVSEQLPVPVREKLEKINSRDHLSALVDRIYELNLMDQMDPTIVSSILSEAGRSRDIAELEINQARKALKTGDQYQGMQHLWNVVRQLYEISNDPEYDNLFISATLKLSDLCFSLGTGFIEVPRFLKKARLIAQGQGDRRSHALINLNLAIFFHIARQHDESLKALTEGLKEVEELGDEDILNRSAAFLGLNFFLQGMFTEAEPYLERATLDFELHGGESMTLGPLPMPFLLGYCVANLGHFHDAVGCLNRSRHLARARGQDALATTIRAILGTVLQMVDQRKEAAFHLNAARQEALENSNTFALAIAEGSLTFQYFLEGRIKEAREKAQQPASLGQSDGFPRLYTAPHILEMIYEMESEGAAPHPGMNFESELSWIRKAPNIHAKGAAYRLMARKATQKEEPVGVTRSLLEKSEKFLEQSGDPIELAKTWIQTAQLDLKENNRAGAADRAIKAYKIFSKYERVDFPDELKILLKKDRAHTKIPDHFQDFLSELLRIFEFRTTSENTDRILSQTLKYACRLLLAERGCIFQWDLHKKSTQPVFWAGYNMTQIDPTLQGFGESVKIVEKTIRTRKPVVVRRNTPDILTDPLPIREILCLPLWKQGKIHGVFYFDNTYLKSRFDLIGDHLLEQAAKFLSEHIDQMLDYSLLKKETSIRSSAQSFQIEQLEREELVFQSRVMTRLLSEVSQVAATDTTILIQGETGVGKEVLARRLHHLSRRRNGPFEVVDLTAIPETLLESELFGYEKGAFTGADRLKRGRIELAQKGTLLLDEIGEIPLSFQVKLLRLLQEKTFVRVGGTRTLNSDFRLIAATNRDLEKEVAAGRFRQDLFYRLNMMPIKVPPLRDREEDIVILARHFLTQYAVKHNRAGLHLLPDDIAVLTSYSWPGNVRELKNVMERAVLLSKDKRLDFSPLRVGISTEYPGARPGPETSGLVEKKIFADIPTLPELERRYIRYVLERSKNKIGGPGGAADVLDVKRTTLYSKMKKLGLPFTP
jgi:transcriptional regulator with GAF, ATPase, and Fis domain